MVHPNLTLCPLIIIFGEVLFVGAIGGGIVHFCEPVLGFHYAKRYVIISYSSVIYALIVMVVLGYIFKVRNRMLSFIERECSVPSYLVLLLFWWVSFGLALFCFLWIFLQAGMMHPILYVGSLNTLQVAALRAEIHRNISINIHNLGLFFLIPINIVISFYLMRKVWLSILSCLLLIVFGTFTLTKASAIYVLIFVLIFRMLITPLYLKKALGYFVIVICGVILLFAYTKYSSLNISSIMRNIGGRILYGQMSELPYYFEVFSNQKIDVKSLMPPYIVKGKKPAARIVAEYSHEKYFSNFPESNEKQVYSNVVGVANTFFTGEAFAWAGYLGVILSPFIIMAHVVFFIYLFAKLRKTWFSVYLFSFFLYKVCIGLFGGISYFIFSSIHIILIAFLVLLIFWRYLESKNIPFFNRIAERLCIL